MDEELLAEFLIESNESLASIEEQLMQLQANPDDEETLNAIFRMVHTVKGSCGFLNLGRLEKVAHAGESLLGRIRSLKFHVTPELVSLLLECADAINAFLEGLQENGAEPELDYSALIGRLQAAERLVGDLQAAGATAQGELLPNKTAKEVPDEAAEPVAHASEASEAANASDPASDSISAQHWLSGFDSSVCGILAANGLNTPDQVVAAGFAVLRGLDGMMPADALRILGQAKAMLASGGLADVPATKEQEISENTGNAAASAEQAKCAGEIDVPASAEAVVEPALHARKQQLPDRLEQGRQAGGRPEPDDRPAQSKTGTGASIRVDVGLLDSLMNQVGELVLVRNRLLRMAHMSGSMEFMRVGREMDQVTEGLQEQLLQTRMQPIKTIWVGVPRIVRDMCKQLHKQIRVVMDGEQTELDRTILNALRDPLTHIIRNSCDHGIESADQRRCAGKPEEGLLRLSASQESGYIVILVEDDGGGIDPARVKAKAIDMGVIGEAEAAGMTDHQALQLVFHPGLSTAAKVSNLSGRGVGMDVVRTEIEKVGGTVDISSVPRRGTTLRIRIPLTLAIISAMVVACQGRRFAIPQVNIRELLQASADSPGWRTIGGKPFFYLRGRLLPVLSLAESLHLDDDVNLHGSVVVIDAGERCYGMLVDEIFGAEEIVVKPLGMHFRHLDIYGGCSILGDGSVIPIMDCNALAHGLPLADYDEPLPEAEQTGPDSSQMQHVLVFAHANRRYAVPMTLIERLESLAPGRIEVSGTREVIQYRDGMVIPVIRWGDLIDVPGADVDTCFGLILAEDRNRLCLQVDEVVDILEVPLEIKKPSPDEFFLGTAVIMDQATEVIDVFDVLKHSDTNWFTKMPEGEGSRRQVLFAEDAAFFRNLVLPVLEAMNFDVLLAEDGHQACALLAEHTPDLILTDLEMPNMDGYQLARWIAGQRHLQGIPVVALTATPPEADDHVRRSLFDDVLVKFDRHSLVEHLTQVMAEKMPDHKVISVDAQVVSGEIMQ